MNRRSKLEVAIGLLLVAGVWFSYARLAACRQEYRTKAAELESAVRLAREVKELRSKPDQATLETHSERALAQAIERSASEAKVDQTRIARIEPQPPRRAGDSPYMEHATVVQLESITLSQLANLAARLRQLDASMGQLHITTLRLDAPYQQEATKEPQGTETWNIEFTLTYFVYSPKSPTSRPS